MSSRNGNDWEKKVEAVADEYDADILVYFGGIYHDADDHLIDLLLNRERRKNLVFVLTTTGGDPHAAYRIARNLQKFYSERVGGSGKFSILVNSVCASAGTLITLGADELIISDHAELGPLDIQLRKADEVGERDSGLTPIQAIDFLEEKSIRLFKNYFGHLRFDVDLGFSSRLSAEIATEMTTGLMKPLYDQIDPIRLAEVDRLLKIAVEYGERLGTPNLQEGALLRLISEYPSHNFVIDPQEAKTLFVEVSTPCPKLKAIDGALRISGMKHLPSQSSIKMEFLNKPQKPPTKTATNSRKVAKNARPIPKSKRT